MALRDALDRLVALEEAVSITDPTTTSIRKAWKTVPPEGTRAPVTPLAINVWTFAQREAFQSLSRRFYTIRIDIATHDRDVDRAADIVTALTEQFLDDLDQDITLNGNVERVDMRGADPTLSVLPVAGADLVNARLFIDFVIRQIKEFSA